jgi:hypothetical protein
VQANNKINNYRFGQNTTPYPWKAWLEEGSQQALEATKDLVQLDDRKAGLEEGSQQVLEATKD